MTKLITPLVFAFGVLFLFAGCGKKPKQPLPAAVSSTVAQPAKTDSGDIFNEFYNDSAENLDKIKNIRTFSLKPSSSVPGAAAAATPSGAYTPAFADNGQFVVQVASMGSRWLADEMATQFKEKGYSAYVLEIQNPTANLVGTFFRVRIGAFATSIDAKAFGDSVLAPAHFDFWVDRKANESSSPLESQLGQGTSSYGTSTYTPSSQPASMPTPSQEPAITPGPGSLPAATTEPPATGGWQDKSEKW